MSDVHGIRLDLYASCRSRRPQLHLELSTRCVTTICDNGVTGQRSGPPPAQCRERSGSRSTGDPARRPFPRAARVGGITRSDPNRWRCSLVGRRPAPRVDDLQQPLRESHAGPRRARLVRSHQRIMPRRSGLTDTGYPYRAAATCRLMPVTGAPYRTLRSSAAPVRPLCGPGLLPPRCHKDQKGLTAFRRSGP
jgi:hypothetical protein